MSQETKCRHCGHEQLYHCTISGDGECTVGSETTPYCDCEHYASEAAATDLSRIAGQHVRVEWRGDLGEEHYWCGCIRYARWSRCTQHANADHDEEPERPAAPVAGAQPEAGSDAATLRELEAIARYVIESPQTFGDWYIKQRLAEEFLSARATVAAQAEEIRDLESEREEAKQLYMAMLEEMNGLRRQLQEHDDATVPQSRAWWRSVAQGLAHA